MLTLPLVFVDLSSNRFSVRENRMLASRPLLSDIKKHPEMFIRQFDDWFKDSTGFREKLINLYRKTDGIPGQNYYLDGRSIVLIGKQGHHFHSRDNTLISIYQGKRWLDDAQLIELANKLNEINQYMCEKNIHFIVMLCANKESRKIIYYIPKPVTSMNCVITMKQVLLSPTKN